MPEIQEFSQFIGHSQIVSDIKGLIRKIARSPVTVLITGENGTGKELVARSIFSESDRADKPLVSVNCAAIPEELIESELFGHEKSAFTGATQQRIGKFEVANKGTLFLDEIGDMSLPTQTKILRCLQEQEFERIGGNQTIRVDVRVIAATNKNLVEEIRRGRFREDLYYRLNVVEIQVPPLRERREDIVPLVNFFIAQFKEKYKKNILGFKPELNHLFTGYDWPGNVRELKNVIERAVVLCPGDQLDVVDLPERFDISRVKPDLIDQLELDPDGLLLPLEVMIKRYIEKVLAHTQGNKLKAARILEIDPKTLRARLRGEGGGRRDDSGD